MGFLFSKAKVLRLTLAWDIRYLCLSVGLLSYNFDSCQEARERS
jgi:hypothetical protein